MCAKLNFYDEQLYAGLMQVFFLMNQSKAAEAMAAELRRRGVKLNADHYLSFWHSYSLKTEESRRMLSYVLNDSSIEMTTASLSFALQCVFLFQIELKLVYR